MIQTPLPSYDRIYKDTVENLRSVIESEYESMKRFCEVSGLDRHNLSRALSPNNSRTMSVETFLRICNTLNDRIGVDREMLATLGNSAKNISLRDYLVINHDAVMRGVLLINYM